MRDTEKVLSDWLRKYEPAPTALRRMRTRIDAQLELAGPPDPQCLVASIFTLAFGVMQEPLFAHPA